MDRIQWLINNLDKSTRSALINNQLNSIPKKYEFIEAENNIHDFKHEKGIFYKFKDMSILKEMNIKGNIYGVLSTIDNTLIKKMIVFDSEGKLVSNTRIKILMDERTCLFKSLDDITLSFCYIAQTKIEYKENLTSDNKSDLYFKNGLLLDKFEQGSIGIKFNDLYIESGVTSQGFIVSKIEHGYTVFKENIFIFKDGKHVNVEITENLSNVFRVEDISTVYKYIILYSKQEKSIDNITRYTKYINIVKDILNNVNLPEYISTIQDSFDFRYNPELSAEENRDNILQYILNYSHQNLDRLFTAENGYISKEFTGKHVKLNTTSNNVWIVPRLRKNQNVNTYVLVFHNGQLIDSYHNIKYIANSVVIPINKTLIKDTDTFEIIYFTDVMNSEYDVTLEEGAEFNYKGLASNMKDVLFFSHELDNNHLYKMEEHIEREYIIPYRYINSTDVSANVIFDNDFYHNKQVKAVSKRQFKVMRYQIPKEHKSQFNYKVYDVDFNTISKPLTNTAFDSIFNTATTGVSLRKSGILDNTQLSIGDIINDIYKNPFPTFVPFSNYAMHIDGYIYLEYDSKYTINLISPSGCKIKIDDVEYCVNMNGQSITNINDSKNISEVYLTRGYHKIDLYFYKYKLEQSGISLSFKRSNEYSYIIPASNIIYKKEPSMKVLKLFNSIFRYCINKDQYILFANNRRMDYKEAIFKFCGLDKVYDANYLILNRAFEEETIIDIIYTPIPMKEVHTERILKNEKGFITIDKYDLGHTLSPEYCSVFINGKKIPVSKLSNVNADTLRIDVNTNTRSNLSIIKHNMYQNVLSDLFLASHDAWTAATKMMNDSQLESLLGSKNYITNDEQDIMNLIYAEDTILWNIINNFWIKRFGLIDAEKLFVYNDEEKFLKSFKSNTPKVYSNYISYGNYIDYINYRDNDDIHTIHEFTCNTESYDYTAREIIVGDFKDLDITKPYSILLNTWAKCNYNSKFQDRFFVRIYNSKTGFYTEYNMSYLEHHPASLSDIPKCYWVRIYLDNVKLSEEYDCISVVCKLYHKNERIRVANDVIAEQNICCTTGIEVLPIDAEVITGCELPYTII